METKMKRLIIIIGCLSAAIGLWASPTMIIHKGVPYLLDTINMRATVFDGIGWSTCPQRIEIPATIRLPQYFNSINGKTDIVSVDTIEMSFNYNINPNLPKRYMSIPKSVKCIKRFEDGGVDTLNIPSTEWWFNVDLNFFWMAKRRCVLLENGNRITSLATPPGLEELDGYRWFNFDIKTAIVSDGVKRLKKMALTLMNVEELILPPSLEVIDNFVALSDQWKADRIYLNCKKLKIGNQGGSKWVYWPTGTLCPMNLKAWCEDYEFFKGKVWGYNSETEQYDSIYQEFHPLFGGPHITIDVPNILQIPNEVKKINYGSFYGCGNVEKVIFPDSLKEIGYKSFANCNLKEITIPAGVTKIGYEAFYNNPADLITIEGKPDEMGARAFKRAGWLYYCKSSTPPAIAPELANSEADSPIPWGSCVHVPVGALEAYKNAPMWCKMYLFEGAPDAGTDGVIRDQGIWVDGSTVNYNVSKGIADIYDLSGNLHKSLTLSGSGSFDASELGTGAYIIKFAADGLSFSRKVIVK